MIVEKLDAMLCLAFQNSEGPFKVKVSYLDHYDWLELSKSEIESLSDLEPVIKIEIVNVLPERRWRDRLSSSDRRFLIRN